MDIKHLASESVKWDFSFRTVVYSSQTTLVVVHNCNGTCAQPSTVFWMVWMSLNVLENIITLAPKATINLLDLNLWMEIQFIIHFILLNPYQFETLISSKSSWLFLKRLKPKFWECIFKAFIKLSTRLVKAVFVTIMTLEKI